MKSTKQYSNKIAIAFDFDETLIPNDSFKVLLRDCQLDVDSFISDRVKPLRDNGWDKYLARAYCLVKESQQRKDGDKITKDRLIELGQQIKLYDGVTEMFDRLRKKAEAVNDEVEVEFYLISGGFIDIPRHTPIAKHFKQMWGCEFQYSNSGEIEFLQRQMTSTEKTRYLYYLSKGVDKQNEKDLIYNYQDLSADEIHIPLSQIIYVGDGASDIPCFTVINQYGGIALGIYAQDNAAKEWEYLENTSVSQRVSNLVPAGYEEDSELMRSLFLAIDCIGKQIALRKLSAGE